MLNRAVNRLVSSAIATAFVCFSALSCVYAATVTDIVSNGELHTIDSFSSKYIADRRVQVWLPDGYSTDTQYAVLYMHDGQMLFDANTTWNKQEWGVDEIASQLMLQQRVKPFIVVGVDNGGNDLRYIEYLPNKPYQRLSLEEQQYLFAPFSETPLENYASVIQSDQYLQFLVKELKPYIDANYSVLTDRDNTAVMGSSMGGLISFYALAEYPEIFGSAACVSTHWVGGSASQSNPITAQFMTYLRDDFPAPGEHRIYFDYGDQTLDQYYPPFQKQVDSIMRDKGYNETNWSTVFDPGADHSENAWRARLEKPLLFLFGR